MHDTLDELPHGYAEILVDASTTGRRPTRVGLDSRRGLGAKAAASGYGWRVLVREHLAASRTDWPTAAAPTSVVSAIEQAIDAFADGYERAQRLAVRDLREHWAPASAEELGLKDRLEPASFAIGVELTEP